MTHSLLLSLSLLIAVGGCYSTTVSDGSGGMGGSGAAGGVGGGSDPCTSSGTVTFEYSGFGAEPDCIVPGVCLTRGRVKGIYNSASELAADSAVSPEGTLWAGSTCAAAATPFDFTTLGTLLPSGDGTGSGGIRDEIVGAELCLWLTNEDLRYDVVFSEWGSVEESSFAYRRTAADADECGVKGASCGATCGCPEGWQSREGVCVLPDPCESTPCGTGATCRKTGATSHRCECDTVEFTKPAGETSVVDCVSSGVCLARGDERGLYNSLEEDESALSGVCQFAVGMRPDIPSFTEWAPVPCASATPEDFTIFYDDGFACTGVPRNVVGTHSCLHTTDDDAFWDVQLTDWCPSAQTTDPSGCFSLVRWHGVGDGEACP